MTEQACGSHSSESTSELPPLEELLREEPVDRKDQVTSNKEVSGEVDVRDENARKSSINRDSSGMLRIDDKIGANMAAATTTSNGHKDSLDLNFIPFLKSTSAAIFVPIPESTNLLSPPHFAPGTVEHHRATLNLLNSHEASVRNNIQALYQREMKRINRDAEAVDSSFDYFNAFANVRSKHEAALKHDLDGMIANMRERDNPAIDYNVKNVPQPNMDSVPMTYVPLNSPREAAARDVLKVIDAATREISNFDRHVGGMSEAIKAQIQAAASRQKQQGGMDID